ncbi:MAG TPA: glycoside hydrolase family 76 protein [Thermomicrobiaceae bacterium]|nr:glycoside hydrolase family 76 protein [Thermomicrobiaceae bacterium]
MPPSDLERAAESYAALKERFGRAPGLLRDVYPGNDAYAYLWPYSQALQATLDMAALPDAGHDYQEDVAARLEGLARYWRPEPAPPGYQSTVMPPLGQRSDVYYDDNLWVALALLEAAGRQGEQGWLDRAAAIFHLIASGWDTDSSHPAPGGVFWVRAGWNRDRNTVSTAPAAKLALHLYQRSGDDTYLDWALRLYTWVERCLRAPDGLYWDHIDLQGKIDRTEWSYNQGTMLGANALLYRATGRQAHLDRAREIAATALRRYGEHNFLGQPVAFNAIFFRNLLLLQAIDGEEDYRPSLRAYVEALWASAFDAATGLIRGEQGKPFTPLDHSAAVQLAALLCWRPEQYAGIA